VFWDTALCDKGPVWWLGDGAPHGYPPGKSAWTYVNDYPLRSRRTKDTQHGLT
jgi:hypothetical protein